MPEKRKRLKQVRESARFTQDDLAHRLGVDKSTVWRWEAGESRPEAWQQPRLAKLLGVSRAKLVELIAEGHPSTSLLAPASRCHALITGLLDHTGSDRLQRELHRVATDSATLLSQLVWDASARRDSRG